MSAALARTWWYIQCLAIISRGNSFWILKSRNTSNFKAILYASFQNPSSYPPPPYPGVLFVGDGNAGARPGWHGGGHGLGAQEPGRQVHHLPGRQAPRWICHHRSYHHFFNLVAVRVVDPHWFNADPDPAFFLIVDPDTDPYPGPNPGFWWPKI